MEETTHPEYICAKSTGVMRPSTISPGQENLSLCQLHSEFDLAACDTVHAL